MQAAEGKAN